MKFLTKLLFGIGAIGLVATLSACGHSSPAEKQAKFVKKVSSKLDLTEAQKPYLETLASAMMQTRQQMKTKRDEQLPKLQAMLTEDHLDKAQLNNMIDAQADILKANREAMLDALVAFHAQLNSEQKQTLYEMFSKFQKHLKD